ncbi:MAG: ABC-type transporter MlaC component [Bermanella sp.]
MKNFKSEKLMKILSTLALMFAFVMPAQSEDIDPQAVVKAVADKVLSEIVKNKQKLDEGPEFLSSLIEANILPIVDQSRMSKMVLNSHWGSMTPDQQLNFTEGFKRLMIKTYAGAFKVYTGQKVSYSDTRFNKSGSKAIVKSTIHMAGGSLVDLEYRLYQVEPNQWQIYDANLAGLGVLKTYRVQFAEQIQKDGIQKTIDRLLAVQL